MNMIVDATRHRLAPHDDDEDDSNIINIFKNSLFKFMPHIMAFLFLSSFISTTLKVLSI